jgi:N-acyl amino acid synthase of PEP-CTERM/exosortase system
MDLAQSQHSLLSGNTRFRVVPAITPRLADEALRIRHRVFCEELALFEARSDRREIDEFDERAVPILLQNTETNEHIGCIRVVKGVPNDPSALLPFESVCRKLVDRDLFDLDATPRSLVGEASRLGVISTYRRRKGESKSPVPFSSESMGAGGSSPDRRQFPYILVALYLGAYVIARREGIEHLFTFTEVRLLDHLTKLGVPVKVVAPPIQHKGLRVPAVVNVSRVVDQLNPYVRTLYQGITRDIEAAYAPMAQDTLDASKP